MPCISSDLRCPKYNLKSPTSDCYVFILNAETGLVRKRSCRAALAHGDKSLARGFSNCGMRTTGSTPAAVLWYTGTV
jgi:hypothetical protein